MTLARKTSLRVLMMLALTFGALSLGTSTADATPVSHLVDCDDSFWAIACGLDPVQPRDEVLGVSLVRIDSGVSCTTLPNGHMICHSSARSALPPS